MLSCAHGSMNMCSIEICKKIGVMGPRFEGFVSTVAMESPDNACEFPP